MAITRTFPGQPGFGSTDYTDTADGLTRVVPASGEYSDPPTNAVLTPALFVNAQAFPSATVTLDDAFLTPALFVNGQAFPSATVGQGAVPFRFFLPVF